MTITYSRSNFATFSTIEKAFAVRRPLCCAGLL